MSLPPFGEDLDAEINHRLRDHNAAIKETDTRTEVTYVPVNERFVDHPRGLGHRPAYDFSVTTAYLAATEYAGRWRRSSRGPTGPGAEAELYRSQSIPRFLKREQPQPWRGLALGEFGTVEEGLCAVSANGGREHEELDLVDKALPQQRTLTLPTAPRPFHGLRGR